MTVADRDRSYGATTKECRRPEAGRGKEWILPWSLLRKHAPAGTLILAQ